MSCSRLLTSSRLKDARACQRLHLFRYELGYRPVRDADALRFGTLLHKGLEAWWRAIPEGAPAALEAAQAALKAHPDVNPYDAVKAEAMLLGYHVRWAEEPYDVLAVEAPFETELRNPTTGRPSQTWRLGGKIDAVVRDRRDGRVLVVEHKTSSEDVGPGSEYWRRLRMDGQVSVYFEGARALGYDVAGCLYDVLKKPGQKPLQPNSKRTTPETPEEYGVRVAEAIGANGLAHYQRGEVVRLESEMTEALFDVWQLGQQIREAELAERFPRNPDACVRFGKTCPFFDVCTGQASLEDASLFRRSKDVHPELSEGEAACPPQP
jgi:hypothetical protein